MQVKGGVINEGLVLKDLSFGKGEAFYIVTWVVKCVAEDICG